MPPEAPVTRTRFPRRPLSTRGKLLHASPHHQRHGRRRRHRPRHPDECGRAAVRGGPEALHRGDQRRRARREERARRRSWSWTTTAPASPTASTPSFPTCSIPPASTSSSRAGPSTPGSWKAGCDACLLVGMHAMAGTPDGVLAYGQRPRMAEPAVQRRARGRDGDQRRALRQLELSRAARHRDEATCREATALLGDGLTTVAVKWDRPAAARNLTPLRAREVIEEGARNALKKLDAVKPYDPGRPAEIAVEFLHRARWTSTADARASR